MQRDPPAGRSTFLLTGAKREILRLLAEYFCETTNGIALLRFRQPRPSHLRATRRTLLLLFREGLVSRLPHFDVERSSGGFTYVYGLSAKGVEFARRRGFTAGAMKPFGAHSARTLDHELLITACHRAAAAMSAGRGLELYWLQRRLKRTVHPDAVFALTDPALPEERNTRYWFLEIERAKTGGYEDGTPHITRKLDAYARYHGSDACERDWGDFREFHVLVVVPTMRRAALLSRAWPASRASRVFVFAAVSELSPGGLAQHLSL